MYVGSVVREDDRRVYMHGALYGGETTAEQERSADFLQERIMLRDDILSLPSYYTKTDIELIIQHLCRSDKRRNLYCMFAVLLCACLYVCM